MTVLFVTVANVFMKKYFLMDKLLLPLQPQIKDENSKSLKIQK